MARESWLHFFDVVFPPVSAGLIAGIYAEAIEQAGFESLFHS
jgi:hypothetical protein